MPATTEPTPILPGLPPVGGKPIEARFDAALMSSDGGPLALREVERRLGLAQRLAACIRDPRSPERVLPGLDEIIRLRMLMIAAGYEDGIDADSLRADPLFKLAMDRLPDHRDLCSQSTVSRAENLPDLRALLRMGRAMVDHYCESFRQVPRRIVLDIDDTFDTVHGGQQLRLFNALYDDYSFQPIDVFDDEGRMIAAVLRPARPYGRQIVAWLRRLIADPGNWPRVEAGPQGTDTRFIVTSLKAVRGRTVYQDGSIAFEHKSLYVVDAARHPLTLPVLQRRFATEEKAQAWLEQARWPKGPVCPFCGSVNGVSRITTRPGRFTRLRCKRRFSVTAVKPMHQTHLPLTTWIIAAYLLAASSKGISANRLSQMLGLR